MDFINTLEHYHNIDFGVYSEINVLQERIAGLSRLEKVKKKLFFTWPYRGHRRNPFFLSGATAAFQ